MFITSNCAELCPILVGQLVNIITEKTNGGGQLVKPKNWGVYLVEGKIGGSILKQGKNGGVYLGRQFAQTHPSGCFGTFP